MVETSSSIHSAEFVLNNFSSKAEELVANPYRHGGKDEARNFFSLYD